MTRLFFILPLFVLISCTHTTIDKTTQLLDKPFKCPDIKAIKTTFPLYLSQLDYDTAKQATVSQVAKEKIQQTILDYYFNDCGGDSSEANFSIKNIYFNTVQLSDSSATVYLIILNHAPSGSVNSKILLYDNNTKSFNDNVVDFNIHGLYDIANEKLKPTNLKEEFKINTPEMEFSNFDKDGIKKLKLTRLNHNGTVNVIETTILKISANKMDTFDFKQKWIGLGAEKP
ncbi:MAG: hypothetical protein EPN85_02660 [Bacteroidetes bacterium]|nr:MAG: hypothetical protein EPN85_02660 [Bacteroidota bacterium]